MSLELKLKALKVADLKAILAKADEQPPAKATKADLISRILASQPAQDAYKQLHEPEEEVVEPAIEEPVPTPAEQPAPAPAAEAPVDPELEKRRARAERFGIPLVEQPTPKQPAPSKLAVNENPDKLAARAARFGIAEPENKKRPAPAEATIDAEEAERRRKRAERFAI